MIYLLRFNIDDAAFLQLALTPSALPSSFVSRLWLLSDYAVGEAVI